MSKCTGDRLSWLFDLVAVLHIRREMQRNAESFDGLETDTTAFVQARIMLGFADEGNRRELDSYATAKKLAKIIDFYTPL